MSETEYVPPKIWEWDAESGGRFAILTARLPVRRMIKNCQ